MPSDRGNDCIMSAPSPAQRSWAGRTGSGRRGAACSPPSRPPTRCSELEAAADAADAAASARCVPRLHFGAAFLLMNSFNNATIPCIAQLLLSIAQVINVARGCAGLAPAATLC